MSPKIIFITGAGSSERYGFPTGIQLMQQAKELCQSKITSTEEMPLNKGRAWLKKFTRDLENSTINSIDSFAFHWNNNEYSEFCKFLIGYLLLPRMQEFLQEKKFIDGWLVHLFNAISEFQQDPVSYKPENLLFITFNYDQVTEYILKEQANNFDAAGKTKWGDFFRKIEVKHVYGALDEPYHEPEDGPSYSSKAHYARNIKLMRSDLENNDFNYPAIFKNAVRFFFMGFGFNDENLKKLGIHKSQSTSFASGDMIMKIIDATCMNCEEWRINQIEVYRLGIPRNRLVSNHVSRSCEELIAKNSASIRELLSR